MFVHLLSEEAALWASAGQRFVIFQPALMHDCFSSFVTLLFRPTGGGGGGLARSGGLGGIKRERDTHTHTPSILLKCSSAGVYAGTPRKAKHLQLLPSSSQDLQIFPLLAFLLSTFTSRVHQLQLCRSILAITTSYSHFSLLEPPPPTHSPLKCPRLAATAKMCPQMCFLIICLKK